MNTTNPYEPNAPAVEAEAVEAEAINDASPTRLPIVGSAVFLIAGCVFLLLLNGQVFTNTLIFLGFVATSGLVWLRFLGRPADKDSRRLAFIVIFAHLCVIVAFARDLPVKYRWQDKFNIRAAERRAGARQMENQ